MTHADAIELTKAWVGVDKCLRHTCELNPLTVEWLKRANMEAQDDLDDYTRQYCAGRWALDLCLPVVPTACLMATCKGQCFTSVDGLLRMSGMNAAPPMNRDRARKLLENVAGDLPAKSPLSGSDIQRLAALSGKNPLRLVPGASREQVLTWMTQPESNDHLHAMCVELGRSLTETTHPEKVAYREAYETALASERQRASRQIELVPDPVVKSRALRTVMRQFLREFYDKCA